jgi:hypothetical protein
MNVSVVGFAKLVCNVLRRFDGSIGVARRGDRGDRPIVAQHGR